MRLVCPCGETDPTGPSHIQTYDYSVGSYNQEYLQSNNGDDTAATLLANGYNGFGCTLHACVS
jgi:hypothetical protein